MPRIDQNGITHPVNSDTFDLERDGAHIRKCEECRAQFPNLLIWLPVVHTVPMSEQTVTSERELIAAAAAPLLKAGYRVESDVPGTMVLVAAKIKVGGVGLVILSFLTFGIVFVLWMGVLMLPRVHRVTLTIEDGVVVKTKRWAYV